jgi:hypothetical protein
MELIRDILALDLQQDGALLSTQHLSDQMHFTFRGKRLLKKKFSLLTEGFKEVKKPMYRHPRYSPYIPFALSVFKELRKIDYSKWQTIEQKDILTKAQVDYFNDLRTYGYTICTPQERLALAEKFSTRNPEAWTATPGKFGQPWGYLYTNLYYRSWCAHDSVWSYLCVHDINNPDAILPQYNPDKIGLFI